MHGMLVQVVIILFPVPFSDFVIVFDHIVHHRPHVLIIPQRHMPAAGIHKDFRFQLRIFRFIDIQMYVSLRKTAITALKILQGVPDGIQDMPLPFLLWQRIPGNSTLQPPQLDARIAAARFCGPFGKKQCLPIQKFLPQSGFYQILFFLQAQDFTGVGIAFQQQLHHLVKGIYHGIRVIILILFKRSQPQKIRGPVQGYPPEIDIAVFLICPVGIASSQAKEDEIPPQLFFFS